MKNALILCTMIPFINMVSEKLSAVEMIAIVVWGIVFMVVAMNEVINSIND